jgi:hypothetical protein
VKLNTCPDSFNGPLEIDVAQFAILCAGEPSQRDWLAPGTNDGMSLLGFTVIVTVA